MYKGKIYTKYIYKVTLAKPERGMGIGKSLLVSQIVEHIKIREHLTKFAEKLIHYIYCNKQKNTWRLFLTA